MRVSATTLPEVLEIVPSRHGDSRGYFSETFRADWFKANVADVAFLQENQALNNKAGVVRGLHTQTPPWAQGKLVRCVAGAIFDVVVDIRQSSPRFGAWTSAVLSEEKGNQLWVPPGFLHGYCTLSDATMICYKVTNYYSQADSRGVRWDDPQIGIKWPDLADPESLSANDRSWPLLRDVPVYFSHLQGSD